MKDIGDTFGAAEVKDKPIHLETRCPKKGNSLKQKEDLGLMFWALCQDLKILKVR